MKSKIKGRLGDIRSGREIGLKPLGGRFAWAACYGCNKERWVRLVGNELASIFCHSCTQRGIWERYRSINSRPMSKEEKRIKILEYRVDTLEKNFLKLVKGISGWA